MYRSSLYVILDVQRFMEEQPSDEYPTLSAFEGCQEAFNQMMNWAKDCEQTSELKKELARAAEQGENDHQTRYSQTVLAPTEMLSLCVCVCVQRANHGRCHRFGSTY